MNAAREKRDRTLNVMQFLITSKTVETRYANLHKNSDILFQKKNEVCLSGGYCLGALVYLFPGAIRS